MPIYHTTIFCGDFPGTSLRESASAWTYEKASGIFRGSRAELRAESDRLLRERGNAPTTHFVGKAYPVYFDMEIMIRARNEFLAREGLYLLCSALDVLHGYAAGYDDPMVEITIYPRGQKNIDNISFFSISGISVACRLSALASKADLSYSIHKLALSYRSACVHYMDLHPLHSAPLQSRKEMLSHVRIANAVTLAYSAIEEMQLEVRASREKPSKLKDGSWNPIVREELEDRLLRSNIDIKLPFTWTLRGAKTELEKARQIPSIGKTKWTAGPVRDCKVSIVDALAYASWLRSTTTTHRFSKTSASLGVCDAYNVQSLARRLLLERFQIWHN